MRRLIFVLLGLVVVVGAIFTGWYFFLQESRFIGTNSLKAVAPDAPLFMEIKEVSSFVKEIKGENDAWNNLKSYSPWHEFDDNISLLDSIIRESADISSFFQNKRLTITFDYVGKEILTPIYIFPLDDISEKLLVTSALQSVFTDNDIQIVKRKYNGVIIFNCSLYIKNQLVKFYYAFPKGLAVFSPSSILVENTILQINDESVEGDPEFRKVHKTAGTNADINLYLNHKYFPRFLKQFVSHDINKQDKEFEQLADWTELDVDIKAQSINWNGFTCSSDSLDQYMNIFKHQSPGNLKIEELLPSRITWFKAFHISNFKKYQEDINRYLRSIGKEDERNTFLSGFKRDTGLDFIRFIDEWFDKDIAFAAIAGEKTSEHYLVLSTRSESLAKEEFVKMLKKYCQRKRKSFTSLVRSYRVDKETSFAIYSNPYSGLHKSLLGSTLNKNQFKYISFINKHVVFSETYGGMTEFLHENLLQETLGQKTDYQVFAEQLSRDCNYYFYCNPSRGIEEVADVFSKELKGKLLTHKDELRKFNALGWKASSSNKMVYNNGSLVYNPVFREEASTQWQSNLDTTINFKPQFVINHLDRSSKEVIVQDLKNQLYLINNSGRIVWKLKLSGPILGRIHQVDYFRNGKLQYLFNTPDKLHIVDRNGNYVDKYPVNFRAPATNGVAVFDYDRNKSYRFFVACNDKKVYAYDKYGKIVIGWKFDKTEGEVAYPVQHIRLGSKDYIVFNDHQKLYIVDRRGAYRVKTKSGQAISNNPVVYEPRTKVAAPRIVYTDKSGGLHYQYFNGVAAKKDIGKASESHFFAYGDIDSDGVGDAIVADGKTLKAFNARRIKIFQKEFKETISVRPVTYTFSRKNRKMGVVTRNDNRIFLVNSNGSVYKGFPLDGASSFSIGFFTKNSQRFNLVVGNDDGFLYNYIVR